MRRALAIVKAYAKIAVVLALLPLVWLLLKLGVMTP